jgi:DNA-binding CsgD family transcriptional regulator
MESFHTFSHDEDWYAAICTLAIVAVLTDSKQHAKGLYDSLLPYADRWVVIGNGGSCRGPVASFLVGLAAVFGDDDAAAGHRAAANAAIEANGAPGAAHWMDLRPLVARASTSARNNPLSAREAEVLALVARGHSNQEIADVLVLSVRTVQRHIENAYTRLGVRNRAGATMAAVELGLVAPGDTRPGLG